MTKPLRLVIFGRQGAGKGTQAARIVEKYGVAHLSTGDMFRAARDEGTPLGSKVGPIMEAGGLVPDDLTIAVVEERLNTDAVKASGFVLDGFPRTPVQAEALVAMLADQGPLDGALNVHVSVEEATERMKSRGRKDDTDEGIAQRLALYDEQTVPTITWFDDYGLLINVDGMGTEAEVTDRVYAAIDGIQTNS